MEDHEPAAVAGRGALRVLVADDEPLIRSALRRLLERRGHHVQAACDAFEALALLDTQTFDAVLVDMRMPGGGASVLARLAEMGFTGPRILMTGDLAADAVGVSQGVRHLQKPFPFPSVIPLLEGSIPA